MVFGDIEQGDWCIHAGEVCQRVRPINTCNAYSFTRGGWLWIEKDAPVASTVSPVYLPTRRATDVEAGPGRVLYWHPCGFWDICERKELQNGEHYYRLSDLPQFAPHQPRCPKPNLKHL